MSWVRYDDGFDSNPKITAVIADNPAAIALHVLARTWTARQRHKGYIPEHQPGLLVCDKKLGADWAAVLLKHGCFHQRGRECSECRERIAMSGWPTQPEGFVFHQWWVYDPPARDRVTPGTPEDLSEKRRAAGRAGGLNSGKSRQRAKQNVEANQANGVSKTVADQSKSDEAKSEANHGYPDFASDFASSPGVSQTEPDVQVQANGVSKTSNAPSNSVTPEPVPVKDASNEASSRLPRHPASANVGDVVAAYVDGATSTGQPEPAGSLRARVGKQARTLIAEGTDVHTLINSAFVMGQGEWNDLAVQVRIDAAARNGGHNGNGHKPASSQQMTFTDEDYASGF